MMKNLISYSVATAAVFIAGTASGQTQVPNTFQSGSPALASEVNENFDVLEQAVQMLESTDPEGPIGKFIEKRGQGIHHLAFAMVNVSRSLKHAADLGVRLIDEVPRKGAEGLQIGFLHPKSTHGVLTEFCGHE